MTGRGGRPAVRLVAVGRELLEGRVTDANTPLLARAVTSRGGRVAGTRAVPDRPDEIRRAVEEGLDAAEGVVVAGGLGPSADDRTREGVAAALGRTLGEVPEGRGELEEGGGGAPATRPGPGGRTRIPEGARPLSNPTGTALAFVCTGGRGWVLALPGVPGEVRALLAEEAGRFLDEALPGEAAATRRIRMVGRSESEVAGRLEGVEELEGLALATYPAPGLVDVRLGPGVGDESGAGLDRAVAAVRRIFGEDVYEVGDRELAGVVLDALRRDGATLAAAESCTGGLLGAELTSVPGASDVYWGGVVAYADEAKEEMLGVSAGTLARHGAVSEATVREMAAGIAERARVDWGVAVTGIAGPGGGTEEKPVGTVWIGVDGPASSAAHYRFPGDRRQVRRRSVVRGLDLLRRLRGRGP